MSQAVAIEESIRSLSHPTIEVVSKKLASGEELSIVRSKSQYWDENLAEYRYGFTLMIDSGVHYSFHCDLEMDFKTASEMFNSAV